LPPVTGGGSIQARHFPVRFIKESTMTRTLLTWVCIVLAALAGCNGSGGDNGGGDEASSGDSTGGAPAGVVLACDPPAAWTVRQKPTDSVLWTAYPPDAAPAGDIAGLTLQYYPSILISDKTLAGCAKRHIRNLTNFSSVNPNLKVVSNEPTTVGDVAMQKLVLTADGYGGVDIPVAHHVWIALSDGYVYQVQAVVSQKSAEKYQPAIDRAVATARWEKGSPEPRE
jgi:hypothetical protein